MSTRPPGIEPGDYTGFRWLHEDIEEGPPVSEVLERDNLTTNKAGIDNEKWVANRYPFLEVEVGENSTYDGKVSIDGEMWMVELKSCQHKRKDGETTKKGRFVYHPAQISGDEENVLFHHSIGHYPPGFDDWRDRRTYGELVVQKSSLRDFIDGYFEAEYGSMESSGAFIYEGNYYFSWERVFRELSPEALVG